MLQTGQLSGPSEGVGDRSESRKMFLLSVYRGAGRRLPGRLRLGCAERKPEGGCRGCPASSRWPVSTLVHLSVCPFMAISAVPARDSFPNSILSSSSRFYGAYDKDVPEMSLSSCPAPARRPPWSALCVLPHQPGFPGESTVLSSRHPQPRLHTATVPRPRNCWTQP